MTFGAFVKEKRGGKLLSLREVASRVGVDPAYLSRVEGGKVRPSEHLVEQLYQRHKKIFPYGYPYAYVPNR